MENILLEQLGHSDFQNMKKEILKKFKKHDKVSGEITRFTQLDNVLDFVLNHQLHFSPLSIFPDHTEGKSLKQATLLGNEKEINGQEIPHYIRREILYASCWHFGDEKLYMWDIYGRDKNCLAIQLNLDNLLENVFAPGNFLFSSKNLDEGFNNKDSNAEKVEISSFHFGKLEYVDLVKKTVKSNLYIGRFKDKAFEHEKELRFLFRQNYKGNQPVGLKDLKCRFLKNAEQNLNVKVIISPYAQKNYLEFITKAFQEYKNIEVIASKFTTLFR
ncbi:DUF2971 domain-containing protein [Daejeonella sp.]|jgi:hypothetical protein|uniref:DUF2971 domain-containing protein n=1 Tax=Daejeonella sp. TaxID=2805397 RepID=UPI0037C0BBDC